ncbi:MAG: glucosyl-3-phosphoglycerate synthase [Roseibacillus sp.]|nr:glucosyl-3-phosphoglycerate synthase [Roseibacillus sp.]
MSISVSWLKSHTFHHREFSDLEALYRAKQRAGLKVSLCIPTLNEEKTIGKEIAILKTALMDRVPLIDEFAVIDSGSTDRTAEICASYGVDFLHSGDILPRFGFKRGKGENLWKGVYQLTGDIICFVDADISNIHPRFVYALIAPLLLNRNTHYVKSFYERPMVHSNGDIRSSGGGRVTEILVRPMFSLFYPELTQLFQPLSGEYAVRREILEKIPFPVGYGVETSHLLDVYEHWGMDAFAQVDLDKRVHRNQSTSALGRMSFGILQSLLGRLAAQGKITTSMKLSSIYRALEITGPHYQEIKTEILEEERPPLVEIEEYLLRFPRLPSEIQGITRGRTHDPTSPPPRR